MATHTHADLLSFVSKRAPHMDSETKSTLATAALAVLAEPRWLKLGIPPMTAVKIALSRHHKPKPAKT